MSPATSRFPSPRLAALIIALATLAAYANSFSGPFVFDDMPSIVDNTSIRDLANWRAVLAPPVGGGITAAGRPLLNLSFALNYALGGLNVAGYHAVNIALHIAAGLLIFGIVRRTLLLPSRRERYGAVATPLAFAIGALWTLHPLQTESVTYIVQRAESLAAVFYLLTLYAFARGAGAPKPRGWWILSCVACACGMASKETVASAPLMVWLYDRTFVAGTFRESWKKHRAVLLGLAATWGLLLYLLASTGWNRGGSIGFGIKTAWWEYSFTQPRAIATYLKLAFWPHPLVFSYEPAWVTSAWQVVPYAIVIVALFVAMLWALRARPALGFLGAWFFVILAPTSSIIPGWLQTTVEHRMYLSLASVVILVVLALHARFGRRSWPVFAVLALALGCTTAARNHDYRSEVSIWTDAAAKRPENGMAHLNAGSALVAIERWDEAIAHFREAVRLDPKGADTYYNLGHALVKIGRVPEAIVQFRAALRIKPDDVGSGRALADALFQSGRVDESIEAYAAVLRYAPDDFDTHYNFAEALAHAERWPEAIQESEAALRVKPDSSAAHNNLGNALLAVGRPREAFEQFTQAVNLDPNNARAHYNLGNSLASAGKFPEATSEFAEAARLEPANADAHNNLGVMLRQTGRMAEARAQFEEALRLRPDFDRARENLESVKGR